MVLVSQSSLKQIQFEMRPTQSPFYFGSVTIRQTETDISISHLIICVVPGVPCKILQLSFKVLTSVNLI